MNYFKFIAHAFMFCLVHQTLPAVSYSNNYSWAKIKSSDGSLCLQEYYNRLQFRKCDSKCPEQNWMMTGEGQLRNGISHTDINNKCIDIPLESNGKFGTSLQMWECNNSKTMEWRIKPLTSNDKNEHRYHIISLWEKASATCMTQEGENKNVSIGQCSSEATKNTFSIEPLDNKHAFDVFPQSALLEYGISYENWMSDIFQKSPDTLIRDAVIPGTHNSGTYDGFFQVSTTQSHTILEQLYAGIRYLDLRVDFRGRKGLVITHGLESGPAGSLEAAFEQIEFYAQHHPREIIFIDLQETPGLKDDHDAEGVSNFQQLAFMLRKYFFSRLQIMQNKNPNNLSFKNMWDANRNVIILVKDFNNFSKAVSNANDLVWFRGAVWHEMWPNSDDFIIIGKKNEIDAQKKYRSWHMNQIIRTPSTGHSVATVLGFNGGPAQLTFEKTPDGYFNYSVAKWLNDWVTKENLSINFVHTDFYHKTNLVPMALWLNLYQLKKKACFSLRYR